MPMHLHKLVKVGKPEGFSKDHVPAHVQIHVCILITENYYFWISEKMNPSDSSKTAKNFKQLQDLFQICLQESFFFVLNFLKGKKGRKKDIPRHVAGR